ncbi:MAG: HEAT repeat domain-containing protein [Planctomycetota bacterium]|jgi:hypothetical protein
MSDARVTNPLVEQFRRGGVQKDVRLMAAQGLLPLGPEDLLEMWTDLIRDSDEGVREAATKSLGEFPAAELLPVAKNRNTPETVLTWAVTYRNEREVRESALQNTSTPDETIEALAPELPTELAELVVINQVRLLRRTSLLEAIERNQRLNNDQRRRLMELRETFKIGEEPAAEAPPPPPEPEPPPPEPEPEPEPEVVPTEDEAMVRYLSPEEHGEPDKVSSVQKIYRMNVPDKMVTALKGTREERAILIRDPNKLVSTAVLGSPRMNPAEVESFSAMKNVSSDVLRAIGNHREWTKSQGVISNLVKNPRTPIGLALTHLPRVNPRDMKLISVDRNVPEAIRKQALKFVRKKQ